MKNIVRVWIGEPFNGGKFNGTAFFIDAETLVTAKHVVQNSKDETYQNIFLSNTPDSGITPISEVILCKKDIAILKVKKKFDEIDGEKITFLQEPSVGDDVNVVGFYDNSSSQKSYKNRVSGYQNHNHTYELQNHLTYGLSGSPVFVGKKISGVTKAINTSKNLTYVVPIEEVCQELNYKIEEPEEMNMLKTEEIESKPTESKSKSLFEFIQPAIMPGIIFMMIFYILSLFIFEDGGEVFLSYIPAFLLFSFLLAQLYLYIKEK